MMLKYIIISLITIILIAIGNPSPVSAVGAGGMCRDTSGNVVGVCDSGLSCRSETGYGLSVCTDETILITEGKACRNSSGDFLGRCATGLECINETGGPVSVCQRRVSGGTGSQSNGSVDLGRAFGFGNVNSLGEGLTRLIIPSFTIASIAVLFYFIIGAFKYLTSGGDKNATQSARDMITHAIIGFILLIMWFLIIQFIPGAIGLTGFKIL